jgi:hypothetical protein
MMEDLTVRLPDWLHDADRNFMRFPVTESNHNRDVIRLQMREGFKERLNGLVYLLGSDDNVPILRRPRFLEPPSQSISAYQHEANLGAVEDLYHIEWKDRLDHLVAR